LICFRLTLPKTKKRILIQQPGDHDDGAMSGQTVLKSAAAGGQQQQQKQQKAPQQQPARAAPTGTATNGVCLWQTA
jgi:hypothetical protein